MRHSSYAAAAASAVGSSSSDLLQQPSTGTSPSMCSSTSPRDEREDRKHGSPASTNPDDAAGAATPPNVASPPATPPRLAGGVSLARGQTSTAATSTARVGANPGTVKLLKEQFERQSSDGSLPFVPRIRVPATSSTGSAESRTTAEDVRHWELLSDAQACAEVIQQLLQEKKELQKQVDSLWSQKEAFRCANERISRVLLRQQQQRRPEGALVAAAEAAGATPRKDLSRRPVNVIPPGSLTARGPRGPRIGNGSIKDMQEIPRLDFSAMRQQQQQQQQVLRHPKQRQEQQEPQQQPRRVLGVPGMAPLNMKAVERSSGGAASSSVDPGRRSTGGADSVSSFHLGGSFTCRASLASSALKTPRRRFDDGGISARTAGRATVRLGSGELPHQQHAAVEQALVASLRSMNLLNHLASGGSSSRKIVKTGGRSSQGDAGRAEFTPESALFRCSSNPDRGYWHTTFLCVLKVEGTDLFLDATTPQHQSVLRSSQRTGSSFFSNSSETPRLTGAHIVASKETAGVFHVCVRHLLKEDNWLRSIVTSMYWGLTSGVDPSRLPPDQTLEHGLSVDETQAGALGTSRISSTPSESGREDEDAATVDGSSSNMFSGWDAVAFMYQRSIDEMGNTVPGKVATPAEGLYISTRTQEGSGPSLFSSRSLSLSSNKSKASSSNSVSSIDDSRRAEPYLSSNQLILQSGQTAEQLFIVRAKDRHTGIMPLYHQATQKYLYTHPTLGVVGLVPPVIEQERRIRLQQKDEHQQAKKSRRRWRARKHQENRQQQQKHDGECSSSGGSSPKSSSKPIHRDTLLRPCRIEMIPLADLLLQQSVQRVLSTVQEAAVQQQQLVQQQLAEQRAAEEEAAKEIARSVASSSEFSSEEEDSFDGIVASEGGEEVDPNKGNTSRRCKPLVPPLGIATATPAASPDAASVSQLPGPLEFKLDDEGVETDVEEGGVNRRSSSNTSSSNTFTNANNSSSMESYYWPTSVEPTKQ